VEELTDKITKAEKDAASEMDTLRSAVKEKTDALSVAATDIETLRAEGSNKLAELEQRLTTEHSHQREKHLDDLRAEKDRADEASDRADELKQTLEQAASAAADVQAKLAAEMLQSESQREQLADELAAQTRMTEIAESDAMAAREHADLRVTEIESANAALEQMREKLNGVEEELATTFSSLTHQATDMVNLEIGIQEAESKALGLQEELSEFEAKSKERFNDALKEAQAEKEKALGESIALSRGFIQEQREHLKVSEARWAQAEELYGSVVKELMDLLESAPAQSEPIYAVLDQLQNILDANRVIVEGNRSIVRGEEGRLTDLMRKLR
jgi:chromosome segregation ATPase